MSGGAGGGSPARASPTARSGLPGWAGLIRVPGCHFSAGEQQRLQSVQWLGRGARGGGAHGGAWGAVLGRQRRNAENVPSWGRCPGFAGIGRMRRSNPCSNRRPTSVMAAVQPRVCGVCRGRQARVPGRRRPRAARPPRATHRRGKVTNVRGKPDGFEAEKKTLHLKAGAVQCTRIVYSTVISDVT